MRKWDDLAGHEQLAVIRRCPDETGNYLQYLDVLRYRDPRLAADLAESVAKITDDVETKCRALFVATSAYLQVWEPDTVRRRLEYLTVLVSRHRLHALEFDLLLRSGWYSFLLGQLTIAEEILAVAIAKASPEDPIQLGRAILMRGIALVRNGRSREAGWHCESALLILPRSARRDRAAALLELAKLRQEAGDLRRADHLLHLASMEIDPEETGNIAAILWARGNVAAEMKAYEDSERFLAQAQAMIPGCLMNQGLIAIDRASVLVRLDRADEAVAEASKVRDFLEAEMPNPHAAAGLLELERIRQQGLNLSVRLAALKAVTQELRESKRAV